MENDSYFSFLIPPDHINVVNNAVGIRLVVILTFVDNIKATITDIPVKNSIIPALVIAQANKCIIG
jgi:hypothetical protein